MKRKIITLSKKLVFISLFAIICASGVLAAPKVKHAIIGSIDTVDKTAKTVAIKTTDGTVEPLNGRVKQRFAV